MPYEGEFAGYRALRRIAEAERVKQLLHRAKVAQTRTTRPLPTPPMVADSSEPLPDFVVAIDGSYNEVDVKIGYPGAKVGYCTVASVLVNLKEMDKLDVNRPVDPREFRKTEEADSIDAALPGTNVVTRHTHSARESFREELYDLFHDVIIDEEDRTRLLDTYNHLLGLKPQGHPQHCPYDGCDQEFHVMPATRSCVCSKGRAVYPTDSLRIHERFVDFGTNGEAFGLVMQVWERMLLIHLLRCFERRNWLDKLKRLAFILDGPLGMFGPPAWMSAAISKELRRLNELVREKSGTDLLILGVEKSGGFVTHFEEIDQTETPGQLLFPPRSYLLLTDRYIKERVVQSDSDKRYGLDTYFGRKFFYKTRCGARIIASMPFLSDAQDTLDSDDISLYPRFGAACALLDKVVSSRYPNSVSPLITAHAHAAIPLVLGAKVLRQLATALMRED
jgi:NurA domain